MDLLVKQLMTIYSLFLQNTEIIKKNYVNTYEALGCVTIEFFFPIILQAWGVERDDSLF